MRLHLKPSIGRSKLQKLGPLDVQELYLSKLDSGLSPRTVQIVHTTLHKALKQAVRWSLVSKNVTEAVTPPKPQKKEIRVLTSEETKRLLRAARGGQVRGPLRLGRHHGDASGRASRIEVGRHRPGRRDLKGEADALGGEDHATEDHQGQPLHPLDRDGEGGPPDAPRARERERVGLLDHQRNYHNLTNRSW